MKELNTKLGHDINAFDFEGNHLAYLFISAWDWDGLNWFYDSLPRHLSHNMYTGDGICWEAKQPDIMLASERFLDVLKKDMEDDDDRYTLSHIYHEQKKLAKLCRAVVSTESDFSKPTSERIFDFFEALTKSEVDLFKIYFD